MSESWLVYFWLRFNYLSLCICHHLLISPLTLPACKSYARHDDGLRVFAGDCLRTCLCTLVADGTMLGMVMLMLSIFSQNSYRVDWIKYALASKRLSLYWFFLSSKLLERLVRLQHIKPDVICLLGNKKEIRNQKKTHPVIHKSAYNNACMAYKLYLLVWV